MVSVPPKEYRTQVEVPVAPEIPSQDWSSIKTAQEVLNLRDAMVLEYIFSLRLALGLANGKIVGTDAWAKEMED